MRCVSAYKAIPAVRESLLHTFYSIEKMVRDVNETDSNLSYWFYGIVLTLCNAPRGEGVAKRDIRGCLIFGNCICIHVTV